MQKSQEKSNLSCVHNYTRFWIEFAAICWSWIKCASLSFLLRSCIVKFVYAKLIGYRYSSDSLHKQFTHDKVPVPRLDMTITHANMCT